MLGWSLNRGSPTRFAEANLLLRQIAEEKFVGTYSWATEQEIAAAPKHIARKLRQKVESAKMRKVPVRLKGIADELAERYCNEGIVPFAFKMDALHIAVATLWKADALVSYNFEHIVSLEIMVAVNKVNRALDLNEVFLCQPQEVIISGG